MTENNKPIKTLRSGLINLSAFEKEIEGNKFVSYTFSKSFKRKDSDKWEYSHTNFNLDDLPKMKLLLEEAYRDEVLSK